MRLIYLKLVPNPPSSMGRWRREALVGGRKFSAYFFLKLVPTPPPRPHLSLSPSPPPLLCGGKRCGRMEWAAGMPRGCSIASGQTRPVFFFFSSNMRCRPQARHRNLNFSFKAICRCQGGAVYFHSQEDSSKPPLIAPAAKLLHGTWCVVGAI